MCDAHILLYIMLSVCVRIVCNAKNEKYYFYGRFHYFILVYGRSFRNFNQI